MLNVVIIEDNDIDLALLTHMIEEVAVKSVCAFENGHDALEYLSETPSADVDLVLCDWALPDMFGDSVLQQFRHYHPDTRFVMISADSSELRVLKARRAGANGYIAKPYTAETVQAQIEKAQTHKNSVSRFQASLKRRLEGV